MDDFKERLVQEEKDLTEKLEKLNAFNGSDKVDQIDPRQKALLSIQAGAMYTYVRCLQERISILN